MATKSIQVRLDQKLKDRAEKIFAGIGIDTPTAIRMFFTKVTSTGGIPFDLSYPEDRYSSKKLAELDQLAVDAKKGKDMFGSFDSVDAMFNHMKRQK